MTELSLLLTISALCVGLSLQESPPGPTNQPTRPSPTRPSPTRPGMTGGMDRRQDMDRDMGQRRRECEGSRRGRGKDNKDSITDMMLMMMMSGGMGRGGGIDPMMTYMMMNQIMDEGRDRGACQRDCDEPTPRPQTPQARPRYHVPCMLSDGDGNNITRTCEMKNGMPMTCDIGPILHRSSGWSYTFCTEPCPDEMQMLIFKGVMRALGMSEREMMGMRDGDMPDREMPDGGPVTDDDRLLINMMMGYMRNFREQCGTVMPTGNPPMQTTIY